MTENIPTPAGLPVAYVNPDGRPHFAAAHARLRAADQAGRIDLATVLIRMLTPAGAMSEWDSATIEQVLTQVDSTLTATGIPTFASADDRPAHQYWADIAGDLGWEHDYEPENEDEEA